MRWLSVGVLILMVFPLFGGCGPDLTAKEFGTIVEGIPHVQGADKPFEMPELGPPPSDELLRRGHD